MDTKNNYYFSKFTVYLIALTDIITYHIMYYRFFKSKTRYTKVQVLLANEKYSLTDRTHYDKA